MNPIELSINDIEYLKTPRKVDAVWWKRLRESMEERGLSSPIVVVQNGSRYFVVDGHLRLVMAKLLDWQTITAIVTSGDPELLWLRYSR